MFRRFKSYLFPFFFLFIISYVNSESNNIQIKQETKENIYLEQFLWNLPPRNALWDWYNIDVKDVSFPSNFLWGTAIAEYQNSGSTTCPLSNWAAWEKNTDTKGQPHITNGQKSNRSCNHWDNYIEDIALMKKLGVNSFRFSIEWSRIEPREGLFRAPALEHYEKLCEALLQNNITPMITLHHFTHPLWFEKKGGFEKEENIKYFVRFCKKVFERLGDKVPLWCTINEPGIYVFQGYIRGEFPPGEKKQFQLAGTVLKNLLIAHKKAYKALKEMPNGQKASIGIVHNFLQILPYRNWNPVEAIPSNYISQLFTHSVLNFFKTGFFQFYIPLYADVTIEEDLEEKCLDFIGLNYYSHPLLQQKLSFKKPLTSSCYPQEKMGDYPYRLYPQGLYEAIEEYSSLSVPIYITENGIPDGDDSRRSIYIPRYLYALSKAIKDGYDVKGYYYWTLMDNFEWKEGFDVKFGLYKVNFATGEKTLRNGAKSYQDIIQKWRRETTPSITSFSPLKPQQTFVTEKKSIPVAQLRPQVTDKPRVATPPRKVAPQQQPQTARPRVVATPLRKVSPHRKPQAARPRVATPPRKATPRPTPRKRTLFKGKKAIPQINFSHNAPSHSSNTKKQKARIFKKNFKQNKR